MPIDDHPRRWHCPGPLCGTDTGYGYGCRLAPCTATVAPTKQARRRAGGIRPRTIVDEAVRTAVLAELRDGRTLSESAERCGISAYQLRAARRRDPSFEAAVQAALGRSTLTRTLRCRPDEPSGSDCGTRPGYFYGCREQPCRQAHSNALAAAPSRQYTTRARRFSADDKTAYTDLVEQGLTLGQAAARLGWSRQAVVTARKTDPAFDAAVTAAADLARDIGTASEKSHPRRTSRITRPDTTR
ncbi:hypothetical protein ACIBEA_41460 [Streptomyces sp. NPDC051555]|uniref:hypothetical protein n=1 Tax=Streptomyces sp. NPDC051555 TaxID=3365657 RepID=UPI00379A56E7